MSQINAKQIQSLRNNFPLYAKLNLKITDKNGQLVHLTLNRMQRVLWFIILGLIRQGRPIRIYLIKARQLGSTTLFSAILYWLITLNKNKRVIGIAQDDEAAENLNLRWQNYYFNSLPELRPKFRKMNPKMLHFSTPLKEIKKTGSTEDIGLDSMMVVKTADSPQLGRSYTYNGALLTEFCIWPQLGIDVKSRMVALNQAIPKRPNTAIFIESTAQGDNYGRKFWDDKKNGYTKIFVSWCADDTYRISLKPSLKTAHYFELSEIEDERYGNELLERKNILQELKFWYPQTEWDEADYPDSQLFRSYEAWLNYESYCRLEWRRQTIDQECEGDKDAFKQEYPTTIRDAFGVSSKSVFGAMKLLEVKEFIRNNNIKPTRFSYHHPTSVRNSTVKNVLSKFSKGRVRIYELPEAQSNYVCGADAAQGVPGGDDSAFVIFKLSPQTGKLIEVCSYNDNTEATEFAGLLYLICSFYNNCLLGVERNDKAGFAVLEMLRKELRYSRLYWYQDPLNKKKTDSGVRWGWLTNDMTRQIMIRDGITWFQKDYINIKSTEIIEQMDTFCENPKTGKIEATAGNHDDLVISVLIAGQLSKQIHIRTSTVKQEVIPYSLGWWVSMSDKKVGRYGGFEKGKGQRRPIKYA